MKYSGFIDSILAEAAFAKKTNDASWLIGRLQIGRASCRERVFV